jgi:hypothetical protein
MILIICAYVFYFLTTLSIGAGTLRLFSYITGAKLNSSYNVFYKFWFGLIIVVGILQIVSLFLPIHTTSFFIFTSLSLLSGIIFYKDVIKYAKYLFTSLGTIHGIIRAIVVLLLIVIVAYSANRPVLHGDTFIYHFNAVKWIREFSAVPGLANLHGRLGFNSSFFLFAALTENGFASGQSSHIALSMLMSVCIVHWFFIISSSSELMRKRIFCLLTSLFLVNHIISQIDITSLSTDYPTAVLTLVFCLILLDNIPYKIFLLLPIAALIFNLKLSGMLTIAIAMLITIGHLLMVKFEHKDFFVRRLHYKLMASSCIVLVFTCVGFMLRNAIVSGWLIYPFPIGNLHLSWSVPKPYVMDMMAWIKQYPKIPGGVNPATIHSNGFFYWFPQWYNQFKLSTEFQLFCISFFILLWSAFQLKSLGKFVYARLNIFVVLLFGALSIVFWFISAPEIRFGSIYFFVFFAACAIFLYEGSKYKSVIGVFIMILFIYQVVNRMPSYVFDRGPDLFTFAYTKPLKLRQVVGSPPDENPPLTLYMPAEGDACGNSPLPCTPYAGGFLQQHRLLRQRVPGDISKGFLPIP